MSVFVREVAGNDVCSLAERFDTPVYVYDQAVLGKRVSEIKGFGTIRYAMKALSNIAVLAFMRRQGVLVECASQGELVRALAAGYQPGKSPPDMVYTCDIFDASSLDFVTRQGIAVNAGSIDMIAQYGKQLGGGELTIRVNPGFGHGHSRKTNTGGPSSKHGIWHEDLPEAIRVADEHGVRIAGVHMHIGSGTDFEHLAMVCDAMKDIAQEVGPSVQMISAGGGLPVAYKDDEEKIDLDRYKSLWQEVRDELSEEFAHPVRLEIEPGRYLSADSGYLLTEIRAIKRMGENTFYLVDAGFNNLARPAMYGSYHKISICPRDGREESDMCEAVVAGPLCESGDMFTQEEGGFVAPRSLPVAQVGDYMIIHTAGAYGATMGSNYNSKPHCAEVLAANGEAHLIRQRQPLEDLFRLETIP